MNYFMAVLPKMSGFFLLVLIGLTAVKTRIIKKEAMPSLSSFLIRIILPALTISLILKNGTTFFTIAEYGRIAVAQFLMYMLLAAAGVLGSKICRLEGTMRNIYCGCSIGGNYGFLVIPLIMTLFQDQGGSAYIPICSVVDTTVVWTLGFSLFTKGINEKENPWKKILLNPILISIVIGLCLTSFQIPVPDTALNVINSVGDSSYSLGLIYLGCSLGFMNPRNILKYRSILLLSAVKLFILPLIVYKTALIFLPRTECLILMLICAAPSMTTSCMIAGEYHLDEEYASAVVVATTLFCMLLIPVLFLLISL